MDRSLLYVSESLLTPADRTAAIADIVAIARARNAALNVTGALISTEGHFAQILEGAEPAIDALMDSICRDARHRDINVVAFQPVDRRRFSSWTIAYSGSATYVAHYIEPLFKDPAACRDGEQAARLTRLIERLVNG